MNTYEAYKNSEFDLAAFGIEGGKNQCGYFCTPVGSDIIGWAGVDGIHYCIIQGFGEMVFAISPMNGHGDYVHPVARTFNDFLRLLLVCNDNAVLEQCRQWSQEQFDAYLGELHVSLEQKAAAEQIAELTGLEPMELPYTYIRSLQKSFDYSKLKFGKEYYENLQGGAAEPAPPQWKVFFKGGFFHHRGKDRQGQEIKIEKSFSWYDEMWYVPSVYVCAKGLVMDICAQVEPARMQSFMDKWNPVINNHNKPTEAQREQMKKENPIDIDFESSVSINGRALRTKGSFGICWIPNMHDGMENNIDANWFLEHYGMDKNKAWAIHRVRFLWASAKKPAIQKLELKLKGSPISFSTELFELSEQGETVVLKHPLSGEKYILTAVEIKQDVVNTAAFYEQYDYPTHITKLYYRVEPHISDSKMRVQDSEQGDNPRKRTVPQTGSSDSSSSLIGSAHGIAILVSEQWSKDNLHATCSSARFEQKANILWKAVFREVLREELKVDLI